MSSGPTTYGFADSTPVRTGQQRHRRGGTTGSAYSGNKGSSAVSSQSLNDYHTPQQSQPENHHVTDAAWDNYTDNTPKKDDSGCNGSLTYSACSSVTSTDSANLSSFADIIKIIESEVDGEGGDITRFMAKNTIPATCIAADPSSSCGGGNNRASEEKSRKEAAIAGWMRHDKLSLMQPQVVKEQPKAKGKKQLLSPVTSCKRSISSTSIVATRYMTQKNDESEFGVELEFNDNILETIAG